jgi:PleD family two-component response regulator
MVALVDIDRMTVINGVFGHRIGDERPDRLYKIITGDVRTTVGCSWGPAAT